jgi:hypothetical protein
MAMFDGPIPGANFAADTKNYAWHRPPDITEYDEAVDYMINKMDDPDQHELVFSLLEIDTKVITVVSTLLLQGIARGKFPIDLAILMAGPLARYIGIIAESQGIKHDMGIDDKDRIKITPTSLKIALGIIDDEEMPTESMAEVTEDEGGLMGIPTGPAAAMPAPEEEQAAMLGMIGDEVIEEEELQDGLA